MSPIQTRPATLRDYPALAAIARESQELHREAHPTLFNSDTPGFTEEQVRSQVEDERYAAYVAEEENGQVIGYVFVHVYLVSFLEVLLPHLIAEINDIAVTEAARGKGVGRQLFDVAVAWAKGKQAVRLELEVWEFNTRARSFYERQGMQTLTRTMNMPLS